MRNLTNYHSHCSFCDGHADPEVFVLEAIRQNFSSYGFSSHAPLPFSTHWSLKMDDLNNYVETILALKKKYESQIELYLGLEIDYLTDSHNPSADLFQNLPLDYRIGSVHLVEDAFGELADLDVKADLFKEKIATRFDNDLRRTVIAYFDKLMRMLDAGGFDIIGHADKISMNASACDPSVVSQNWYLAKIKEYFSLIAEKQVIMEINTKAYPDKGFFFPNLNHFDLIRQLGIRVQVNSDAHYPEKINDGRDAALDSLKSAGIKEVWELHKGVWTPVAIR